MNRTLRTSLGAMAVGITEKQKQIRNQKISEIIEMACLQIKIGMPKDSIEKVLGHGNTIKVTNKYHIKRYLDTYTESTSTSIYITGTMGVRTGRVKCYIEVKYNENDISIEIIKKGLNGIQKQNESIIDEQVNDNINIHLDKLVKDVGSYDDSKYLDITGRDVLFYKIGYICCMGKNSNECMINRNFLIFNSEDNYDLNDEEEESIEEIGEEFYNRYRFIILQLISEGIIRIKKEKIFSYNGREWLAFELLMRPEEFIEKYKLNESNINYQSIVLDYNTDNEYEKEVILTEKYEYDKDYDRRLYCDANNRDKKFFETGLLLLSQNKDTFSFDEINLLIRNRLEIDNQNRIRHILKQLEEAFVLREIYNKNDNYDDFSDSITYFITMPMSEYVSKYSNGANNVYYKTRREYYNYYYGIDDNDNGNDDNNENEEISNYLNGKNKTMVVLFCIFLGIYGIHNFIMGENKKGISKLIILLWFGVLNKSISSNNNEIILNAFTSVLAIIIGVLWIKDLVQIIKNEYEVDFNKWV